MKILNVAGGKINPLECMDFKEFKDVKYPYHKYNTLLVNLDSMYFNTVDEKHIEKAILIFDASGGFYNKTKEVYYSNCDIYKFLECFTGKFNHVCIYRFLEHVPKVKVLYFLYILSTIMEINSTLDIIVPDYKLLSERILNEDVKSLNFEAEDIITTFELLNEPYCPHASIWTEDRIKHFFELEGRFKVLETLKNYEFDGRDIYLRSLIKRIK